jgi:sec-independent protein translocase protein TatA
VSCVGFQEGLLVVFVVALFFGARRLPQLGEALGRSIKNFKKGMAGEEIDVTDRTQVGPGEDEEPPVDPDAKS